MSCKYKYKDSWYSKQELQELLYKEKGITKEGKLIKPNINTENTKVKKYELEVDAVKQGFFDTKEEAERVGKLAEETGVDYLVKEVYVQQGVTPKLTKENTTSIESVKSKIVNPKLNDWRLIPGPGGKDANWAVEYQLDKEADIELFDTEQEARNFIKSLQEKKAEEKEYTEQALINTKIAKLKEVAKKYPRSLITSKVINNFTIEKQFQKVERFNNNVYGKIDSVNNRYGRGTRVVGINDAGIVDIDVTPIADAIIEQRKDEVNNFADVIQFRKTYNLEGVDEETLAGFEAKATLMEKRFSELGIPSHIIFDGDIAESAQNLGTGSQRYRDMVAEGAINDGDIVIVVNPNNLFTDTVFHEYGHTFIDMAGGMNNTRIKYAANRLKNTSLAKQVVEQYPELSGDALAKEILATALGKEANQIFTDAENISFFQKFLDWIRSQIRNVFGIENTTVKDLANELLGNTSEISLDNGISNVTQLQKGYGFTAKTQQKIRNAEGAMKKINDRFTLILASVAKSTDEAKVNYKKYVEEVKADVDVAAAISDINGIAAFIQKSIQLADGLNSTMDVYMNQISEGKNVTIDSMILNQMDMYRNLFNLVNDVRNIVNSPEFKTEFEKAGYGDDEKADFLKNLNTLVTTNEDIRKKQLEVGRHHIANKLVPYSNRRIVERRMEIEREEKSKFPRKENESGKEYNQRIRDLVNDKLVKEIPQLKRAEKEYILERLMSGPADINSFAAMVSSEKDLNSMLIQMASKLLDEVDLIRDQNMLLFKQEAFSVFQEFDKATSGTDAKAKYKGLYQESSDGKLYLANEYNIEWYVQRNKLWKDYYATTKGTKEATEAWDKIKEWDSKNSIKEGINMKPNDKWLNKDYTEAMRNPAKKKMLEFLKKTSLDNHKRLHGNLSLIKTTPYSNTQFIQLPSIGKSTFEKATSGSWVNNVKDYFERWTKVKADETEFGQTDIDEELVEDKNVLRVITDAAGRTKSGVPIHFRGPMDLKDISYDLLSSITIDTYMSMNYNAKSGLQSELELLKEVAKEKEIAQTQSMLKKTMLSGLSKKEQIEVEKIAGKDSKEFKVLQSVIENRLYGVKTIASEYAQLASSVMSWTANTMLMFNLPSAMVNAVQGKVFNFIEAAGGQFFTRQDLLKAESLYFRDLHRNLDDMGKPVQTSLTNQMMDLLNIQGSMKAISNKFIENNRAKALFKRNTGYALQHMGEHYMHATLMYSILNNVKTMNKDGKFIDKDGKVVSKDKAMSLAEAITLDKDNKLVLNPHVHKTSHGNSVFSLDLKKGKGLLEIKGLVNKIAHDLHGNYNEDLQNMAQRYVWGKAIFMLKKWLVPGFNKRWRGAVYMFKGIPLDERREQDVMYSEDLQEFQEGYYVTGVNFVLKVMKALKEMQLSMIRKDWDALSDMEKANMRRFIIEVGIILTSLAASILLASLAGELPEDEWEREAMFYSAYITRRMYSELFSYTNPAEAFKIMKSPAASMAMVTKLFLFGEQLTLDSFNVTFGDGLELYQSGRHRGTPKLYKRTADIIPFWTQTNRDIEESFSYIKNLW